ncbi:MAG: hypothetical protein Ct9H300mP4_02190 [Gammaproteobacteria bacterium]|nr:MAG: hypothetical protein Ct9H300mP4_02190 [Gammaproteobacteria bacterium]
MIILGLTLLWSLKKIEMNYLVFDIETIPDLDYGKQFLNLDGLEEAILAEHVFSTTTENWNRIFTFKSS